MCPAEQPAPRFSCDTCVFTTSFTTRITRARTHPAEQPAPRFYCDYMCPHSITTRVLTLLLYIYIYICPAGRPVAHGATHVSSPHSITTRVLTLLLYIYIYVHQDGLRPTAQHMCPHLILLLHVSSHYCCIYIYMSFRTACGPRRNPRDPFLSVLPFQKKKKRICIQASRRHWRARAAGQETKRMT
jgi:hypothetical protein